MTDHPTTLAAVADASSKAAEWLARRDWLIRTAVDAGHSQREVARAAGLSHTGVARIYARTPEHPV